MKNKLFSTCEVKRRVIYHFNNFSPLGLLFYRAHASSPRTLGWRLQAEFTVHKSWKIKLRAPTVQNQTHTAHSACPTTQTDLAFLPHVQNCSQTVLIQEHFVPAVCFPVLLQLMPQCGTCVYSGYTLQWGLQGHSTSWSKTEEQSWYRWGSRAKNKISLSLF